MRREVTKKIDKFLFLRCIILDILVFLVKSHYLFRFLNLLKAKKTYICTMQHIIAKLKESLAPLYDTREVKAITSLLLEEVCGITRMDMIMHPDLVLDADRTALLECYAQRLSGGEPVQQVLGYEYFMGNRFEVNPDVLIPRPETAELVEWIIGDYSLGNRDFPTPLTVLDIGTGSGCIALSLALINRDINIHAVDLSTGALDTARRNAERLNISNVTFVQMDILAGQDKSYPHPDVDKFDVIVSNPPYIMHREKAEMNANVLEHEPHLALFVPDDDPLLFYRAIARFGRINLKQGGRLYFEINAALGRETCALLSDMGYRDVTLRQDINGRDRMISATL